MKMWLKNTAGKRDAMLSMAFGGFIVTCLAIILSFLGEVTIGGFSFKVVLTAAHVGLLTLFLGATVTAYVSRRNKKDDHASKLEELRLRKELGFPPPEKELEE